MKFFSQLIFKIVSLLLLSVLLVSCFNRPLQSNKKTTVSISKLTDEASMEAISKAQYLQLLSSSSVVSKADYTALIQKVGGRLASGTNTYLTQKGDQYLLKDFVWEFNGLQDKGVNLFCLPNGRILVNTGLLEALPTEQELAFLLSHELAHAVLKHDFVLMDQALKNEMNGLQLKQALHDQSFKTQQLFSRIYGLDKSSNAEFHFSKQQELDADELSFYILAMSGYNPSDAYSFWENQSKKSLLFPVFLKHPIDASRLKKMKKFAANALQKFKPYNY